MKKLSILICLGFLFINGFSKTMLNKNQLRVGCNASFFGYGDNLGKGLGIEYDYSLSKYITVCIQLYSSSGFLQREIVYESSEDYGAAIFGRLYPFNWKVLHGLYFDGGFVIHHFTNYYSVYDTQNLNNNQLNSYTKTYMGILGSIGFDIINTDKFILGPKLNMISSLNTEGFLVNGWQFNLTAGIKF